MRASKVDYRADKIPLVPALHCLLGGIIIDSMGRTSVEGLFAAGESATGVHGAVRLGGTAFAECFVFGTRAGGQAAIEALGSKPTPLSKALIQEHMGGFFQGKPIGLSVLQEKLAALQEQAWQSLGVIRNADGLERGKNFFHQLLCEQAEWKTQDWEVLQKSITLRNLAMTGLACAAAALARKETRGGHIREDFPDEDDRYLAWFVNDASDPGKCTKRMLSHPNKTDSGKAVHMEPGERGKDVH